MIDNPFEYLVNALTNSVRHKHYRETLKQAKFVRDINTHETEKQFEYILKYRIRETNQQKLQRLRLTNSSTSSAVAPVYSYLEEVLRVDNVTKIIKHTDEKVEIEVRQKMENYVDGFSIYRWLFDMMYLAQKNDPNMWVVFESDMVTGFEGAVTDVNMYPILFESKDVIDYKRDKYGNLSYFIGRRTRFAELKDNPGDRVEMEDYYMYMPGMTIHLSEYSADMHNAINYEDLGYELITIDVKDSADDARYDEGNWWLYNLLGYPYEELYGRGNSILPYIESYVNRQPPVLSSSYSKDSVRQFYVNTVKTNTEEAPPHPLGAFPCAKESNEIFESIVEPARPILMDLMRDKSYLDVVKTLHTFPRLFQFVKPCNNEHKEYGQCYGGYYGGIRELLYQCVECGGTGKRTQGGEQDLIELEWPRNHDDMVDLEKLSHYETLSEWLPGWLREEHDREMRSVILACFNQELRPNMTQAATATEVVIENNKIYNKLSIFAEHLSRGWVKAHRLAFQYLGKQSGIENLSMVHPLDYRLKSEAQLVAEYKAMVDAGLPSPILFKKQLDILKKQYRDNPLIIMNIEAFNSFMPFSDKTPEQINAIIAKRDNTDYDVVLWENFPRIQMEIYRDDPDTPFALRTLDDQQAEITEKVEDLNRTIRYRTTPTDIMQLQMAPLQEDTEADNPGAAEDTITEQTPVINATGS